MTKRDELERRLHRLGADVVLGARSGARLFDGLAREDAERDRDRERCRKLGERPRHGMGEDVEMSGLTSDQTAERDDSVEAPRPGQHRDGRRQLERARHLELVDLRTRSEGGVQGPAGQGPSDLVVPASTDDRHARAEMEILSPGRSLPSTRHLPQSSPRMHSSLVAG